MNNFSYSGKWPLFFLLVLLAIAAFWYFKGPKGNTETVTTDGAPIPEITLEQIRQRGVLRVGMEPESPPMYFEQEGRKQGFDMEVIESLAGRMGVDKVEVVEALYDYLPELAKNGKVDVFMSGYIPDDSIDGVDWSDGYLEFGFCLITKKGSGIQNIRQLKGKKIGIYDDPAAADWVKENIPGYSSLSKYQGVGWLRNLNDGSVDAVIYDYPFAAKEVLEFPDLRIVELNLNTTEYAIGMAKGSTDLKNTINKLLPSFLTSASYERVVKAYLESEAVEVEDLPTNSKAYVVKGGDTLLQIAQTELGDAKKWKEIWELNKKRLPNPNLIKPGFSLQIP
ncbi:MAG TPA: transporter substrate-binding domain-containing protein [Rhodothermales bacterium]|nr:transporter substrate-binding domain-containing protein [Rhodothermales bacterium]